jgi:lysophospholipase L1-like esterase
MKTAHKALILGLALSLAVAGGASAQADFTKYIAFGDSLTAGVVSYGTVQTYHQNSVPALIARQAGVASFQQPLVSEPGLPPLMQLTKLSLTPFGVSPTITFKSGVGSPINATLSGPYNNLGIDGANTNDLMTRTGNILNLQADMLRYAQGQVGKVVPISDLVLRDGKTTAIQQAIGAGGTFYTITIGSNEVLGAALTAVVVDGITMTPLGTFQTQYHNLLAALKAQRPSAKVMVATVQDVLPFVTTVKPYLIVAATGQRIPLFGEAGVLTDNDYLTLQASSLIAQGIGIPTAAGGTGIPLPEGSIDATGLHAGVIIRAAEAATLFKRIADMNTVIKSQAQTFGYGVVDIWAAFRDWDAHGVIVGGVDVTTGFLTGGIFSLDGAHPQQLGYGLIANEWIKAINEQFGNALPMVSLRPLALSTQTATSVQAAGFVLDPATGMQMIKGYAPYALTDKLTPTRSLRNRGPVAEPALQAAPRKN